MYLCSYHQIKQFRFCSNPSLNGVIWKLVADPDAAFKHRIYDPRIHDRLTGVHVTKSPNKVPIDLLSTPFDKGQWFPSKWKIDLSTFLSLAWHHHLTHTERSSDMVKLPSATRHSIWGHSLQIGVRKSKFYKKLIEQNSNFEIDIKTSLIKKICIDECWFSCCS